MKISFQSNTLKLFLFAAFCLQGVSINAQEIPGVDDFPGLYPDEDETQEIIDEAEDSISPPNSTSEPVITCDSSGICYETDYQIDRGIESRWIYKNQKVYMILPNGERVFLYDIQYEVLVWENSLLPARTFNVTIRLPDGTRISMTNTIYPGGIYLSVNIDGVIISYLCDHDANDSGAFICREFRRTGKRPEEGIKPTDMSGISRQSRSNGPNQ